MEIHISQTARSHINMIENHFKLQLNQNSTILQKKLDEAEKKLNEAVKKLNEAEKKLKVYRDQYGELKTSNLQQSTNIPSSSPVQKDSPPPTLPKPKSGGAIPKKYEN